MATKQIQLRGISRTPSDRMTADGGLAEALNVHLEDNEQAPTLPPTDVTDIVDGEGHRVFPDSSCPWPWEVVFIHKTPLYRKAIVKFVDNEVTKLGTVNTNGAVVPFVSLEETESFVRCLSLGNTLGVVTSVHIHWVLFKDGNFEPLGVDVPFPAMEFINVEKPAREADAQGNGKITRQIQLSWSQLNNVDRIWTDTSCLPVDYGVYTFDNVRRQDVWDAIDAAIYDNKKSGIFNHQMVAVFAIKMYDGTRLMSTPVVLAPGFENPFDIAIHYEHNDDFTWDDESGQYNYSHEDKFTATINFKAAYKIMLRSLENSDFFDDWSDIVTDIEVYLSPEIAANLSRAVDATYDYSEETESAGGDTPTGEVDGEGNPIYDHQSGYVHLSGDGKVRLGASDYSYKDQYLAASHFFLAASFPANAVTMAQLADGVELDLSDLLPNDTETTRTFNDALLTKQQLDVLSDMSHYSVLYRQSLLYNSKIIANDISDIKTFNLHNIGLSFHYHTDYLGRDGIITPPLPGYDGWGGEGYHMYRGIYLRVIFLLRDDNGHEYTIQAKSGESLDVAYGELGPIYFIDSRGFQRHAYGLLMCPDVKAYAAILEFAMLGVNYEPDYSTHEVQRRRVEMTRHPYLPCTYYYGGIDVPLGECGTLETDEGVFGNYPDQYISSAPNKVYISEQDNPFVFPLASRFTFASPVVGCAIATDALSIGQFGQFPLYVFTDDGIWALEAGSDGTFLSQKPVSRDVCASAKSITSIDKAIIFITEKAVMMLTGSQIVDLSPNMNGKHFAIDEDSDEYGLIARSPWGKLAPTLKDDTHFMAFMKEAVIAYDYIGNRLVFIKYDEEYQYVYMLKTNSWHKIYLGNDYQITPQLSFVLNAYPSSYINAKIVENGNETRKIWDFSTVLDVTSNDNLMGIIITRPFDLGEPDIRKTITNVRIRGQFNRYDVQYVLLGSFDGIHWQRLRSLRGGSYKLFRMILLCNMSPTERISWIDIDYESRFTNKLR